jgi:hypothetical protein
MFRRFRVHQVPRLGVAHELIHRGFKPAGVIQAGSGNADDAAFGIFSAGQPRAAFGAEPAKIVSAAKARRGVMLHRALCDFEVFQRHDHHRRVRSAADLLTVAAMALEHHERFGIAFVSDLAANTTAGKRKFHGINGSAIFEKF